MEERFQKLSEEDKKFIIEFDHEIQRLGYDYGNKIGSGFCWSKYMIVYSKIGVKNKKVVARIYINKSSIWLRLFLNNVNKHSSYIKNAPDYIKEVFTNDKGLCGHCEHKKDKCNFRKMYNIDGKEIHKCSGVTFEFLNPSLTYLPGYIGLLTEFYTKKKSVK